MPILGKPMMMSAAGMPNSTNSKTIEDVKPRVDNEIVKIREISTMLEIAIIYQNRGEKLLSSLFSANSLDLETASWFFTLGITRTTSKVLWQTHKRLGQQK